MTKLCCIAVALLALVSGAPAWAEDSGEAQRWLSEVRFGVLAHDEAPIVANVETGIDVNADVLFTSPRSLEWFHAPRPFVGVTIASEGISHLHGGMSWDWDIGSSRWFGTGAVGLAAHNGDPLLEDEQTPYEAETEKALGCRVNFYLYVGLGYRLSRRWNVAAHYEHLSNATLCESNEALENIGVRVGRVF